MGLTKIMRKIWTRLVASGVLISALLLPASALASNNWISTDNFDSYSTGGLNGDNGGSGWSAAWVASASVQVENTVVHSASNAVVTSVAGDEGDRAITGISSGSLDIYMRATSNSANGPMIILRDNAGSETQMLVAFKSDGTWCARNAGAACTSLGTSYAIDTWYKVTIVFNVSTAKYDVYVDGTLIGNQLGFQFGGGANIDQLGLGNLGGTTGYFDDIAPIPVATPATRIPIRLNNGGIRINNGGIRIN